MGAIQNMLKKIGVPAVVTSRSEETEQANQLILPGVGAFGTGMANIWQMGLLVLTEGFEEELETLHGVRTAVGEVAVLTGDGVLLLETVETPAAGRTSAAKTIRSVRTRLGLDAEAELLLLQQRVRRLEEQAGRSD